MKVTTELKNIIKRKIMEENNKKAKERFALPKEVDKKVKTIKRTYKKLDELKNELDKMCPYSDMDKNGFYSRYGNIVGLVSNKEKLDENEVIATLQYIDSKKGNEILQKILKGDFSTITGGKEKK